MSCVSCDLAYYTMILFTSEAVPESRQQACNARQNLYGIARERPCRHGREMTALLGGFSSTGPSFQRLREEFSRTR